MKLKSGNIVRFEEYSQFSSLDEFNTHIEMWMAAYKHEFTKGELIGMKRLVRYAAKIPGVCNAKIGTVLKAIHEEYEGNGISRSTFKRMIQKAISIGIFTVYETERKNGSQSSNLYVFNRFPVTNEPPKQLNHPKTSNLFKTKNINNTNKRNDDVLVDTFAESTQEENRQVSGVCRNDNLDYTYTNDKVPQEFTSLVKCFFPEAKTIEEYWKITSISAYRNNRETETETECVLEVAIKSFKQMIGKIKRQVVRNPFAYYYGVLNNKFHDVFMEELDEMGFPNDKEVDWDDAVSNLLTILRNSEGNNVGLEK